MLWTLLTLACKDAAVDSAAPHVPGLKAGEVQACEAPVPLGYREAGVELGLQGPQVTPEYMFDSGALLLADVDQDGELDLVHSWEDETLVVFGFGGGEPRSLATEGGGSFFFLEESQQLMMVGGALFEIDVVAGEAQQVVSDLGGGRLRSPSVADLDGDGLVDFFIPRGHPEDPEIRRDLVAWGQADGSWELEILSLDAAGEGFDSQLVDWNGDGWMDVYVDNDRGQTRGHNEFYLGGPQGLELATDQCGACNLAHSGMGAHSADLNGDGAPDLVLAGTRFTDLLMSTGPGSPWVLVAQTGLPDLGMDGMYWGVVATDIDNDGRPDLWMGTGPQSYPDMPSNIEPGEPSANVLALQQDDGSFRDVAADLGVDLVGSWRGVLVWDLNEDGVQDLIAGSAIGRPLVYLSEGCTENSWLAVDAPVGSRVEVETEEGVLVGWVSTEQGFGSIAPARLHLGLGASEEILGLTVKLPAGGQSYSAGPMEARRVVTLDVE